MWSTMVPQFEIQSGQFTGLFRGNMAFFVKGTPTDEPHYVFTINVVSVYVILQYWHETCGLHLVDRGSCTHWKTMKMLSEYSSV